MSLIVFNFQVIKPFGYDPSHDVTAIPGNEGVEVRRPEAGAYGIYRASFDIHVPGPGIADGATRTIADWKAFLRTVQGPFDTFLWKDPLTEYLYEVQPGDVDGQIGTGTGSQTDFPLAHRHLDEATLEVYVNAVLQNPTAYSLEDNNTAAPFIRFVTAPGNTLPVTVAYEFYHPVRLVEDPSSPWRGGGKDFLSSLSITEDYAGAHRV